MSDYQWTPKWLDEAFEKTKAGLGTLPGVKDLINPLRLSLEKLFEAAYEGRGQRAVLDTHSEHLAALKKRIERLEKIITEMRLRP